MDGELSKNIAASPAMHDYFNQLQSAINSCYTIAAQAKKKGLDPADTVEIPQALDLAARVEQLVGPEGIAPKIRQMTKKRAIENWSHLKSLGLLPREQPIHLKP